MEKIIILIIYLLINSRLIHNESPVMFKIVTFTVMSNDNLMMSYVVTLQSHFSTLSTVNILLSNFPDYTYLHTFTLLLLLHFQFRALSVETVFHSMVLVLLLKKDPQLPAE